MIAIFQVPNKFFDQAGRVTDAGGKDWDQSWEARVMAGTFAPRVGQCRASTRWVKLTRTWRNGRRKGLKIPCGDSRLGSSSQRPHQRKPMHCALQA